MITLNDFFGAFFPQADEPIYLRTFNAKGIPPSLELPAQNIAVTRQTLASDKHLQSRLKKLNEEQGIYFVVNSGGTKKADISRINAIYCEKDDMRTLTEQHDLYDQVMPPSIRVETARSVHAYWLLNESISIEQFCQLQLGLIQFFKSDPSIKEQNRVMRVPYFNHVSFDIGEYIYKKVQIHTFNPSIKFSFNELTEMFPYTAPKNEKKYSPIPYGNYDINTLEGTKVELRRRISELPSYRIENREYASAQGLCHSGKSKSCLTVNLISGYVYCRHGCDFETILATFGLEIPKPKQFRQVKIVPAPVQTSELYQYLQRIKQNEQQQIH